MSAKVIAIAMDGGEPELIEPWMDAGLLPGLARLRSEGAWGRVRGGGSYQAEAVWTSLVTGCEPDRTGYWSSLAYEPETYGARDRGAYDYVAHPPFYALDDRRRVAVIDVPQTRPRPGVNGPQLVAWGAHAPAHDSCSWPPELFGELVARHGRHPALRRDHATFWNPVAVARLRRALRAGIPRRVAICRELLAREEWDLFITAFGETHSAGHHLWHLSGATGHPLHRERARDPLLAVFQAVDGAIQEVVEAAGDAAVVVFAPHGMESATDLASLVFLPELCYRLAFPGRRALAPGGEGPPAAVVRHPRALTWDRWLWRNRGVDGAADLLPPHDLGAMSYQPAAWYRDLWPRMPAFALPSYFEGNVRINLAGRERDGIVPPERYESVCAAMEDRVRELRDARTGRPIVREVLRTRTGPHDRTPGLPDADLVVCWSGGADAVDSPAVGRMGPVPFGRTGTHVNHGFVAVRGPGAEPGSRLPEGRVVDVAATILELAGAAPRQPIDGRPLLAARDEGACRPG
jgi:predicted AlkP superfamily phosphohydrolase/phosphomutase